MAKMIRVSFPRRLRQYATWRAKHILALYDLRILAREHDVQIGAFVNVGLRRKAVLMLSDGHDERTANTSMALLSQRTSRHKIDCWASRCHCHGFNRLLIADLPCANLIQASMRGNVVYSDVSDSRGLVVRIA